jgi:hypothetical protein
MFETNPGKKYEVDLSLAKDCGRPTAGGSQPVVPVMSAHAVIGRIEITRSPATPPASCIILQSEAFFYDHLTA